MILEDGVLLGTTYLPYVSMEFHYSLAAGTSM